MTKWKIFISVIVSLFLNPACGQMFKQTESDFLDNKFCIKMAPLAIFDAYNGSALRIGIEKKIYQNHAAYLEFGTYLPLWRPYSADNANTKGVIGSLEYKYYMNKIAFTSDLYFSAELFYKYQSYSAADSIDSNPDYLKKYDVSKNVASLNFKVGRLTVFKKGIKGFIVDLFAGTGVRIKNVSNTLSDFENNNMIGIGDYDINKQNNLGTGGWTIVPNLLVGIKIGYRLK
jgi:hypothetical protein